MSLEDLMNVQVTSVSKRAERISDAPAAVTVIGQNDIQRSGLNSIPELLRLVPGMDVARINANEWAISARGFNGPFADDLLALMDGRSIYTPTHGGVVWSRIDYPLADIDRIEVIRGPGATLWGSNAVNGVVNIISKPADQTQGYLFKTRVGTDESDGVVRYGGKIDDLTFFRGYVKYGYDASFPLAADDLNHDQWQSLQTGFRIDRYSTPTDTFTLHGDFNEQQLKDRFVSVLDATSLGNGYEHGSNLLARWTHSPSVNEETSLQIYYSGQDSLTQPSGYHENDFDLQFQNRFMLGRRQELTWGFGARDSLVRFVPVDGNIFRPLNRSEYLLNTFVQDQITIVPDRLQWSIGTKLEYNNISNFDIQPGTRIAWTPDKQNTVWAAVSRPVRTPSLDEVVVEQFGPLEVVPDHVHAERTVAYELGYKVQPAKAVTVDASGFYNTYRGLIVAVPSPQSPLLNYWANSVAAQSYGAELAAEWQATARWKLAGSYTFTNVETISDGAGLAANLPRSVVQAKANADPQNQFQLHSYYDITRNLQFNTSGYYVEGLPQLQQGARVQNVPDYFRLDLGVTWQATEKVSVTVGAQNILQSRHKETGNVGATVSSGEVPRSAYVQLRMEF